MDSLTHLVLGAALGEVAAGRTLGNRALLWGAVGCSIPDLDTLAALVSDEITALSFHRGIMHAFAFLAVVMWPLAWMATLFYRHNIHNRKYYKLAVLVVSAVVFLISTAGVIFIPKLLGFALQWWLGVPLAALAYWLGRRLWNDYWLRDLGAVTLRYWPWLKLFGVTLFAHTLLDCCTNYGTQVWQPFSDVKVQWNLIAVADLLFTFPLIIAVAAVSRIPRGRRSRIRWAIAGLVWAGLYLGYCGWNKARVNRIFENSLQARGISVDRYITGPTLFQNIVWYGLAEGDTAYYWGQYGFNDEETAFTRISTLPKGHNLLPVSTKNDRTLYFIKWFTDGYYNVLPYRGDTMRVNDLRFGLTSDTLKQENYVYSFLLFQKENGAWDIHALNKNREKMLQEENAIYHLWRRILGYLP